MNLHVKAIFENGLLRPLEPLNLAEGQQVILAISTITEGQELPNLDGGFIETLRKQLKDSGPAPGIEEVRKRMSKIPGSMSEVIIEERRERGER
jgi:predicted DNA-binding antitoxin AbrB/MazE fold protein